MWLTPSIPTVRRLNQIAVSLRLDRVDSNFQASQDYTVRKCLWRIQDSHLKGAQSAAGKQKIMKERNQYLNLWWQAPTQLTSQTQFMANRMSLFQLAGSTHRHLGFYVLSECPQHRVPESKVHTIKPCYAAAGGVYRSKATSNGGVFFFLHMLASISCHLSFWS